MDSSFFNARAQGARGRKGKTKQEKQHDLFRCAIGIITFVGVFPALLFPCVLAHLAPLR
jgi:hypothetical protein